MTDAEIQQFQTDKQRKLNQAAKRHHSCNSEAAEEPFVHLYCYTVKFSAFR